ncbi:MAG: hypothetical protein ACP5DC_09940 [Halothiobacillaceae bacterium]
MNYERRIGIVRDAVLDFLQRFSAPRGMSDQAQAKMIASIAESLNRKLPLVGDDEFRELLRKTFENVLDQHESYAWPTQAIIIRSIPHSPKHRGNLESYVPKGDDTMASKIAAGEPVPEAAVWGRCASDLLASGRVTQKQIDAYRRNTISNLHAVYGRSGIELLRRRYGDQVDGYL